MAPHQGRTALYRLYGDAENLLYVGITNNPQTRWKQHAERKPWWGAVVVREVEWFSSRAGAERAEAQLISECRPIHNDAPGMPPRTPPDLTRKKIQKGWEPDARMLHLLSAFQEKEVELAAARDEFEAEIIAVMRTGVSASRLAKFLPWRTPLIQALGKKAGVPLLRAPTVEGLRGSTA